MKVKRGLAIIFALALVLAACGDDDDSDVDTSGAESNADTGSGSNTDTGYGDQGSDATTAPAGDSVAVAVASDDELGDYLVDAEGRTVYLFAKDDGTTTACTGSCADNWPPLIADGEPTGGDGIDAAELGTADGIDPDQVTYHGHLLYYFAGDQEPGDTNGTSVPEWYAVNPSGDPIETDGE